MPGPPSNPSTIGQQARPSSQGASVPEMHWQPAARQPPGPQSPLPPQKPPQQPTQLAPQEQVAGQTTPSSWQRPPKQRLGGTHVPDPPGRSGLSAQQTRPGVHVPRTPVRQRQPSSAHGRICASARDLASPIPAIAAAAAARPNRASAPRRDCRVASRFTRSSNRSCSMVSPPSPQRRHPSPRLGTTASSHHARSHPRVLGPATG